MTIRLTGSDWIKLEGEMGRQGVLTSNLAREGDDEETRLWNANVDGFEAAVLAMFSHLPPSAMAEFEQAVMSAADALDNLP